MRDDDRRAAATNWIALRFFAAGNYKGAVATDVHIANAQWMCRCQPAGKRRLGRQNPGSRQLRHVRKTEPSSPSSSLTVLFNPVLPPNGLIQQHESIRARVDQVTDRRSNPSRGRSDEHRGHVLSSLSRQGSYRQHGPEVKRRLAASAHPPDIILLQEARVPEPNIVGYRAFSTPTIIVGQKGPRQKRDAQGNISVPLAHAHVLLQKSIPAAQLDTSCYCSEQREVTAVSAHLRDKDIVVVTTNDEDVEWLKLLCTRTIHPFSVLIGGDINAHHTSWGSKSNTIRGRSVADNALVAGLVLNNSPDAVTHRADSQQQDSTSPNVLAELPPHEPLFNRIIQAKEVVTQSVKDSAEAPTPDQHLLNLWESRIKAQHCYLEGGKLPPDRARFNCASAEAKRNSLELSQKEWHDHCTSFNGRTSPAKVWATMRGMTKNQRQQTAGEDMALRLAISNEEFASKAGPVFFHRNVQRVMTQPRLDFHSLHLNNPWTQGALFSITKLHGAPGPDMITVPALRNLPEAAMQELLDIVNESWELGQLPAIWRHASVIPIPKPGQTPKQLADMRPISLTSHVGKLMERMALMRLEWDIEANNVLHPCQTGFRRGLSTQDSLALFAEDLAGKHPRYDIKIAVAIDVKKAFDSVPHPTVMAAASAAGLTGKPLQYIGVSVGNPQAPAAPLELGVPQGAVLSPLLYNLLMADSSHHLDKIPGICHTIYADDVTIWTTGGPVGPQNDSAQEALDIVAEFLIERGLTPSPDKTQYAVFGNTNARREATPCIELKFGGTVITTTNVLRVLGVDFSAHGPPVTWLSKTKASVVHMLHLIRRTTTKDWGADTHTLRIESLNKATLSEYRIPFLWHLADNTVALFNNILVRCSGIGQRQSRVSLSSSSRFFNATILGPAIRFLLLFYSLLRADAEVRCSSSTHFFILMTRYEQHDLDSMPQLRLRQLAQATATARLGLAKAPLHLRRGPKMAAPDALQTRSLGVSVL
ncbi:hypothetical protein HPB47_007917 [Ixodes persulcatus]|uniref:Uncharacterized protein n=1 Tax=Ixodes persulcatus TaxID=34615 RepID=A0AC60P6B2_IXOPE|nr:hypothetical protein HPB47_007917 [Ixodes persulcatus]